MFWGAIVSPLSGDRCHEVEHRDSANGADDDVSCSAGTVRSDGGYGWCE